MTLAKGIPTIIKGKEYFNIVTYEGNGGGQTVGNFVPFTDNGTIAKSVIMDKASSPRLSRTPSSAGNRKTWTLSLWVKRTILASPRHMILTQSNSGGTAGDFFFFNTDNTIKFTDDDSGDYNLVTNRTFEDTSKFYHIVLAVDTTQSTASNRVKLYVDGDQITSFGTSSYPAEDYSFHINNTAHPMNLFSDYGNSGSEYSDGYIAEVNLVDGTALTPSTFGLTDTSTGTWIPKTLTGITYGTNGFRMQFANSAGQTIGDDTSGNGNDYAVSNIATTDIVTDSPTQNFATGYHEQSDNGTITRAEGNLYAVQGNNTSKMGTMRSTLTLDPNDPNLYYCEYHVGQEHGGNGTIVGISDVRADGVRMNSSTLKFGVGSNYMFACDTYVVHERDGTDVGTANDSTLNPEYTTNDYIGIAFQAGKVWIAKNNTWSNSGNPSNGTGHLIELSKNSLYRFVAGQYGSASGNYGTFNFGQKSFNYTPPTGAKNLQQDNLPAGTAGIPDMVWIKNRDATDFNTIYDTSRGHSKELYPNDTSVEASAVADGLKKFVKDGFTIEDATNLNTVGESFVSWMWTCNGGTTAANTDGSGATLASTIQVNQTAGFSMVRYDGSGTGSSVAGKVAHGLGKKPDWIMVKCETHAHEWTVYHVGSSDPSDKVLYLNATNAETDWPYFGDTDPTSSVFTVSSDLQTGRVNYDYIAYCWTAIEGFSKFGAYVGNGSTNGPFVNLGFRPSWLMVKRLDSTNNWQIFDSNRNKFNPVDLRLYADVTTVEAQGTSSDIFDFTATGFKVREDNAAINASSGRYLYCAFADHPFIGNGTNPVTAF